MREHEKRIPVEGCNHVLFAQPEYQVVINRRLFRQREAREVVQQLALDLIESPAVRRAFAQPGELGLETGLRHTCALDKSPPRLAQHLRQLVHERHQASVAVSPPERRLARAGPQNHHMRPGPFGRRDEIRPAQPPLHAAIARRNDATFVPSRSDRPCGAEPARTACRARLRSAASLIGIAANARAPSFDAVPSAQVRHSQNPAGPPHAAHRA